MSEARPPAASARRHDVPDLRDSRLYLNRELSWLQFNARVLEEALDPGNPLLERAKFLSIFASNLDEFFMIRVSGLRRQLASGVLETPPDGMMPAAQLTEIRARLKPLLAQASRCWHDELQPRLHAEGIRVLDYEGISAKQRHKLRRRFETEVFPALTPLAFDPGHPFPHISNLSINLAVVVNEPGHGERFARLKVPMMFNRLWRVPRGKKQARLARSGLEDVRSADFVWLEQIVADNLDLLFPGIEIVGSHAFRVTRDADFAIEEDEASDLLAAMVEVVGQRHFGSAVRLEIDRHMPDRIRDILVSNLGVERYQVYSMQPPLARADLMELTRIDRPDLKDAPYHATVPAALVPERNVFAAIRSGDALLVHPYDSFSPVLDFVRAAAADPDVLAIKQTLYRTGPNSPVVRSLMEAREEGKQVSAIVELKARFDEENNIGWARALERAGVHVVYGLLGLKVHAKMSLVVRREADGIVRYVHLSTGSYNPETARVYTDIGLFTTDPDIGADVSDLFNALTGYSRKREYRKLLVSPRGMREAIVSRIRREIDHHLEHGDGHVAFKLNALVDPECIRALYEASMAGVRVELQVRGICCLRPGVAGVSDNVRVTSVVGRFLEHARIYYFRNGGAAEVFVGSADLMPRNLGGRVEVLFPIEHPRLRRAVCEQVLELHLADNTKARLLLEDGTYARRVPGEGEQPVDSQLELLRGSRPWHMDD